MGLSSFTIASSAVIAGCTAFYNLWLFWLRPSSRAHLWLGVAAIGVLQVGVGLALLYDAQDLEEAVFAHRVAINCAPFIVVGFLRFTAILLDVRIRRLECASGIFALGVAASCDFFPDLFFTGAPIESVAPFGEHYVEAAFRPTIAFVMPGFMGMFVALIYLYGRYRHRIESSSLLLGSIVFWWITALNDAAIVSGAYHGPYLVAFGFVGFAMAFTGLLQQRFVHSMTQLEASTEALQQIVEERSRELRERDLQVTHGSRMATIGAISAGLAREIHGPVSMVAERLDDLPACFKDPAAADRFDTLIEEARGGTDRIRMIVSDLLRISRRESADEGPVDLCDVVTSVLPMAEMEARQRERIVTDLRPVPPVLGSETLLSQVVLNLVVNALHAPADPDRAERVITVRTAYEDGSVWLTVEDNGPGIPAARLASLFDPFGPGDDGEADGPGLGLAVTHQIVGRHRGEISVESSERGVRFVIEFPAAPHAPAGSAMEEVR